MVDFIQALGRHIKGDVTDLQKERATECASCEDKEQRVYADILDSKMVEINGYVCTRCDCPLATKIFAKGKKNICNKWRR
jgi:hypothetical protein